MPVIQPAVNRYPATWPVPQRDGNSGVIDVGMVRSSQEGFPQQFRFTGTSPTRLSLVFRISRAMWDDWLAWVNQYGVGRWSIIPCVDQYRRDNITETYDWSIVQFDGRIVRTPVGHNYYDAACQVELLPYDIGEGKAGELLSPDLVEPDLPAKPPSPDRCKPYDCDALNKLDPSWSTFQSDAATFPFPTPTDYDIAPGTFTGGVITAEVLPTNQKPAVDACTPDTLGRYVRLRERVNQTTTAIYPKDRAANGGAIRAIIGPAGQVRTGLSLEPQIRTYFKFFNYFQAPNGSWRNLQVRVSMTTNSSKSDGVYDELVVTMAHTGTGSYWVAQGDDKTDWANALTAGEYAALWPSAPFNGTQPFDQATGGSISTVYKMDDLFPDPDYLWVPISIRMSCGPVFKQHLAGRQHVADRDSFWFKPVVTLRLGDEPTRTMSITGDLMITNTGDAYATVAPPDIAPTGESSNVYFSADAITNHCVALGGLGSGAVGWDEFTLAFKRNQSNYVIPPDCPTP